MPGAAAEAQVPVPSLGEAQRHFELFFGEEGPGATAAPAVPPRRPTLAVAAFEAQAPSTPMGAQGTAPPSYRHMTPLHTASWSAAAMTTPRPASEEAIAQWLEDIGLADTPGLLDALARGAGSLKGLRTMSDEAINAAVSPLQLRSLKLRKLNAALIALRCPAELAQRLFSPTTALADEPPSRPKKQAPAAPHTGQISARGLEAQRTRRSGPMLEMPTGGHESAELSDLAAMLSMRDSKRDSKVAELAKVAAVSAAEDERRARLEAAKDAALSRARAAAKRAAQAATANPETTTLAVIEAAAIEAARSPITAFTPRTALAVDEMLARDLHAALDAAALGAALSAASSAAPIPPTTAPASPALPPVSAPSAEEEKGAHGAPLCTPRTGSQPLMSKAPAPASSRKGVALQYTTRMLSPSYEQPWPSIQGGSGSAASLASLGSPAAGGDDDSMAPQLHSMEPLSRRALMGAVEAPAGERAEEELLTPRTKALSSVMTKALSSVRSAQDGEMTPRSRTLNVELVARDEVILKPEKASGAVVAADKAAAVSTKASKVKPKKLKGAKKLKSAQFSLDIGDMQFSTTLDSKWLAKPLLDALVMPAIEGYLSGKHLSGDTSCAASEVATTFNGEVIDCSASALSFAQSVPVGQVVRMAVLLPDRLTAALAASASADAGGESLSNSKTFVVSIVHSTKENTSPRTLARAPADAYSITMELNARWLGMPLWESLVAPAIRAYTKANREAQSPSSIEAIQITLDGNVVDGARPASEFVGAISDAGQATPEAPTRVSLVLPDTAPAVQPRASARASLGGTLLDAVTHAVSSGKGRVRTLSA